VEAREPEQEESRQRPLPPWVRRRVVTIDPGAAIAFHDGDWHDALVVVAAGRLEIECIRGGRRSFSRGSVLWLTGIDARLLHSCDGEPTVLISFSRRCHPP